MSAGVRGGAPLAAPQKGHCFHRLQRSITFLSSARRVFTSVRGLRRRRRSGGRSSSGTITRAHVLQMHCRMLSVFLK